MNAINKVISSNCGTWMSAKAVSVQAKETVGRVIPILERMVVSGNARKRIVKNRVVFLSNC